MSLTPTGRDNARALAALVERERANLAWWRLPHYLECDPAVPPNPLALKLWRREQAGVDAQVRSARRGERRRKWNGVTQRKAA